jgi:hypothetical protein
MASTALKPPTKAEKRAEVKALVSEYAKLMYPSDREVEALSVPELKANADRAYRLAARIVEMGIDLGLYR